MKVILDRTEKQQMNLIPEKPGVYIGYNQTKYGNLRLTYIGQTQNLRKRLWRHEQPFTHVSFEIIDKADIHKGTIQNQLDDREKKLIEKYQPHFNTCFNRTKNIQKREWDDDF